MNLNNIKYESVENIVNIDSIDRDWINTEEETWKFQIRFNGTSDSNDIRKEILQMGPNGIPLEVRNTVQLR